MPSAKNLSPRICKAKSIYQKSTTTFSFMPLAKIKHGTTLDPPMELLGRCYNSKDARASVKGSESHKSTLTVSQPNTFILFFSPRFPRFPPANPNCIHQRCTLLGPLSHICQPHKVDPPKVKWINPPPSPPNKKNNQTDEPKGLTNRMFKSSLGSCFSLLAARLSFV